MYDKFILFSLRHQLKLIKIEKGKQNGNKLSKRRKRSNHKKFGKDAKDSGSAEVQIALLTQKITELTEHLKTTKKDFQGRRGLLMMVGQRKRLLAYVKKQDLQKYRDLIKELGIRG